MTPAALTRVGKYEIRAPVGGTGRVYRGSRDGQQLAVTRATQSNELILIQNFR